MQKKTKVLKQVEYLEYLKIFGGLSIMEMILQKYEAKYETFLSQKNDLCDE